MLLDWRPVRADGYQLLERMRGEAQWRDMRVIVMSPRASIERSVQVLPWGADGLS